MSNERVQTVRNFTSHLIVLQALTGTPVAPYNALNAPTVKLDKLQRVGRIRVVLAANAAVTITDTNGLAYTVTNPAGAATLIHEIPIINGHKNVLLSGSGTVPVVVLAD